MTEQTVSSEFVQREPELRRVQSEPKGVLKKNLKVMIYLGAALVVVVAAFLSSSGKKAGSHSSAVRNEPPQPVIQDNTDNNVRDLKNQLAAERQKESQMASLSSPLSQPAMAPNSPQVPQPGRAGYETNGQMATCAPGQPCLQQQPQLSPEQQQSQLLAAKERELAYDSRFASNLVYAPSAGTPAGSPSDVKAPTDSNTPEDINHAGIGKTASSVLSADHAQGQRDADSAGSADKRKTEINIDSAVGQPYVIYEGLAMDTILMNRLDGDAAGPVKVMVSNPVYSHDRQHVLIPDGTVALGEARKIGASGFGQQRRMAVVFHRMIMPDGYSVDLDQFHGLDQIGEEGLKDKVNNHYLQIFGTSIALGIISGAAQIESGGGAITTSGSQALTTGFASSVSQSATSVLERFTQIPPTITIREGHRVKVYFTQDMLLPAYDNHTIPQTF
jgi:type IV secretory pathway VirB10-like protein